MKKIRRSSEFLWLLGIIFVALGVSVCSKADLGVSMIAAPAFVLQEFFSKLFENLTVGVTEYIIQGIMLVILCVAVRRFTWKYLLAFAVAILYGYTLDFFIRLLGGTSFDAVWLRYVMLIVGDIITAFGVACFFKTFMPLQVYELFVAEISSRFGIKLTKVKLTFDLTLLSVSVLLAFTLFGDAASFDWSNIAGTSYHSIGTGTLITTAINSPIIGLMSKLIDKFFEPTPLFPRLRSALGRN